MKNFINTEILLLVFPWLFRINDEEQANISTSKINDSTMPAQLLINKSKSTKCDTHAFPSIIRQPFN